MASSSSSVLFINTTSRLLLLKLPLILMLALYLQTFSFAGFISSLTSTNSNNSYKSSNLNYQIVKPKVLKYFFNNGGVSTCDNHFNSLLLSLNNDNSVATLLPKLCDISSAGIVVNRPRNSHDTPFSLPSSSIIRNYSPLVSHFSTENDDLQRQQLLASVSSFPLITGLLSLMSSIGRNKVGVGSGIFAAAAPEFEYDSNDYEYDYGDPNFHYDDQGSAQPRTSKPGKKYILIIIN